MKIQIVKHWFSLLFIMMIAIGCTQSTEYIETTLPTGSASPTTSISTTTKTLTPTLTPVATSVPVAIPTLPEEEAHNRLLALLSNNGGCHLPCLWGITPGLSNYQDAQIILMPLGSISPKDVTYFDLAGVSGVLFGAISPVHIDDKQRFNSLIVYRYDNTGVVKRIFFQAMEEEWVTDSNGNWTEKTPIYDSPIFIQRIEYYSLSHLLEEQGMPDSVSIRVSAQFYNRSGSIEIHIAVFYLNQGIWAHYTSFISPDRLGSTIQICPLYMHIEMELYPPGNPDAFIAHLEEETAWKALKGGFKPLEEVTSMSLEQFYEMFRNTTDRCFETPVNLWPTPEP